jgi:hypothetical protein
MICRTEGGAPIAFKFFLNEQEMRKLEALKVRGVQREEKRKKPLYVSWKAYFFFV